MAYVIVGTCIDCKDASCVACCPVDCIYEGARTYYIHSDECINCGICVSVRPPEAIYEDADVPENLTHFIAINREFFSIAVSAVGSPGGASTLAAIPCDHPLPTQSLPQGTGACANGQRPRARSAEKRALCPERTMSLKFEPLRLARFEHYSGSPRRGPGPRWRMPRSAAAGA